MIARKATLLDTSIALYTKGQYNEALALLDEVVRSCSASADILNVAAACAYALNRTEDAEYYWKSALQADPEYVHAYNNLGILFHRSGRHAEAEAAYRNALALRPEHAEAHYNLGLLYQDSGRLHDALTCYREAVRIQPDYAEAHNNLGAIFKLSADREQAEACFRRALASVPSYAEAANNLGLLLQEMQRHAEAEEAYRRAHVTRRDDVEILWRLVAVCEAQGKLSDAIDACQRVVALHPQHAEAFHRLGNLLQQAGHLDSAHACYRRTLELQPDNADLHNNLGVLLTKLKQPAGAEFAYRRALSLRPVYPEALHNLALLYLQLERFNAAEEALFALLHIQPDHAEAYASLANLFQRTHHLAEAEGAYRRSLALRADHAATLNDFGTLLQQTRRFADAEAAYRQAMAISPHYPEPKWNLGFLLLYQGRLEEGWPLMEARHDKALARPIAVKPDLPFPEWSGQQLYGKSIVVMAEQGFGDVIQFVRYLPHLKRAGASRVTLVCKAALVPLLQAAPGADRVLAEGEIAKRMDSHDYWVLMLSLPLRFRTTLETIPAQLPYLEPDPGRVHRWSKRMPAGGARVGLVWKGFGGHVNDANRSLPDLSGLAPLWHVKEAAFISLQRGMNQEPGLAAHPDFPLLDLGPDILDFADTAAIVSQLDLVICVDTAIAHVAGALGKRCWVLLPHTHPDWRWMDARADSPWYPDVIKLYRQAAPGDWKSLAQRVASELARWIGSR
ncbi:MAG TPA: tetratricopeptide repeat protein [Noviherbaspirillum sp.]|nr:tetratricopeptide repeat protein [Noviherbaspirillum sp.]